MQDSPSLSQHTDPAGPGTPAGRGPAWAVQMLARYYPDLLKEIAEAPAVVEALDHILAMGKTSPTLEQIAALHKAGAPDAPPPTWCQRLAYQIPLRPGQRRHRKGNGGRR